MDFDIGYIGFLGYMYMYIMMLNSIIIGYRIC